MDIKLTSTEWYNKGNECRRNQDLEGALNAYQEAIELDPSSPAVHARQMLIDILEFYHKDAYNP